MSDELNTRLSLGKGTLRQFFKSRWLATHWGHCDLKVSENYPDPTCLAPQKMWHLQTKFTAHWVTHGDNHSTQILHPTLGHALVLHKKDRYQSCFSCYHWLFTFVPIPASLYNLIHPALEPKLKIKLQLPQNISHQIPSLSSHDHKWLLQ